MPRARFISVLRTLVEDIIASFRIAADTHSRLRLAADFVLSRFISIIPRDRRNRERQIRIIKGAKIRYRLNKGDLNSIREIWFQEAYRLPFAVSPGVLLDLGANIGLTSLWLSKNYAFTEVIAVEPDPSNAALVRQNFDLNEISGQILKMAVGPTEMSARFELSDCSNLGRLSDKGSFVQVVSVGGIIQQFAVKKFSLVKIDIEGGEEGLFHGPTEWLSITDAIIIEFHPAVVDYPSLTDVVSSKGFKYISSGSLFPGNMDCFKKT